MSANPKNSPSLVTWKIVEKKMPWGVLLFLGGGFALSDACTKTGSWILSGCFFASQGMRVAAHWTRVPFHVELLFCHYWAQFKKEIS